MLRVLKTHLFAKSNLKYINRQDQILAHEQADRVVERLKFGDRIQVLASELSFDEQEIFRAISRANTGTLWLHNDLVRKNRVIEGQISLVLCCLEPHEEPICSCSFAVKGLTKAEKEIESNFQIPKFSAE